MSKKLYVGSLPYSVDDNQLRELASPFGAVLSATVIMDKFSGRSKGFGFVEFESDSDAQNAISGLNGKDVGGRALVVNEARPMGSGGGGFRNNNRRSGGGGGGGGFGNKRGRDRDRDRDRW